MLVDDNVDYFGALGSRGKVGREFVYRMLDYRL